MQAAGASHSAQLRRLNLLHQAPARLTIMQLLNDATYVTPCFSNETFQV